MSTLSKRERERREKEETGFVQGRLTVTCNERIADRSTAKDSKPGAKGKRGTDPHRAPCDRTLQRGSAAPHSVVPIARCTTRGCAACSDVQRQKHRHGEVEKRPEPKTGDRRVHDDVSSRHAAFVRQVVDNQVMLHCANLHHPSDPGG